jgi:site-specific DNA recombinase
MIMNAKRVLAAIRLSKDSDESTSVEGQREAIGTWAAASGYVFVAEAVDVDVSGGTPSLERPELAKQLRDLGAFDIVAGIKIDRLSRDTGDFLAFAKFLNDQGKWLASTGEGICLKGDGSAADTMTATVLAAAATMERQRIAERCKDSRARLLKVGRWGGGVPPFGYAIYDTGKGKTLVQDPVRARYAEAMAERAIDGHSNGRIARWLNSEGVKTQRGHRWEPETVGQVLRGHSLAGYAVRYPRRLKDGKRIRAGMAQRVRDDDGADVMITSEPVLTDEQWRLLQEALDSRGQKRAPRRLGAHQLLRVAYCRACSVQPGKVKASSLRPDGTFDMPAPGKLVPMYGHRDQGSSRQAIYRCQSCGYSAPKAALEDTVEAILMHAVGDRPLPRRVEIPAVSHTAELAELEGKIADLDEQYQADALPARTYARMMTKLEARREELAALPQRAAEVRYEHDDDSPTVRDHWASLTSEDRGAFLRAWGVQIFADRAGCTTKLGWENAEETGSEMAEAFGLTDAA